MDKPCLKRARDCSAALSLSSMLPSSLRSSRARAQSDRVGSPEERRSTLRMQEHDVRPLDASGNSLEWTSRKLISSHGAPKPTAA